MEKRYMIMKYYGSKRRMVDTIQKFLPEDYGVWVEGCLGSGAVSINKKKALSCSNHILNEKEPALFHFWKTLADREQGKELLDLIARSRTDYEAFQTAHRYVGFRPKSMSDEEYACCVFLEVALSYDGLRKHYGKSVNKPTFEQRVEQDIRPVYERFQQEHTEIRNMELLELLEEIGTLPEEKQRQYMVYLDPPYMHNLRHGSTAYLCEMPYMTHIAMLEHLQHLKCRVLLSGYLNDGFDVYCEKLLPAGYQCYLAKELDKSCSRTGWKQTREVGKEYLWCNYPVGEDAGERVMYEVQTIPA